MTVRLPKPAAGPAATWSRSFHNAARAAWLAEPTNDRTRSAALTCAGALVALVGGPDDPEAREAYHALRSVLMAERRSGDWRAAVAAIPPDPEVVRAVSRTVRRYNRHAAAGHFEAFDRAAGVRLREVVPTIVRVARVGEEFVDLARDRWWRHPNRVFSEDAVREAAGRIRSLGEFAGAEGAVRSREALGRVRVVGL